MPDEKQVLRFAQDDKSHLERLAAEPRAVGSPANHAARQYCADHLRSLGFNVTERPFEFSALPGRYAAQIIGSLALLGFIASRFLFAPWFGELTAALVLILTYWFGSRFATREPWFREKGVNLEASRGQPKVWLVAHIDSKSQPIPTLVRSIGVVLLAGGLTLQFMLRWPADFFAYYMGIAGGIILLAAAVGSRSFGAADNASGVAAVLDAAALVPADRSFGVLITDAEELALAGATAWAAGREKGIAINCDTVDDTGRFAVFQYGLVTRPVDEAAILAVKHVDDRPRLGKAPIGVLTDSNAFHRAGWPTVTLARGTIRTLSRIHTRRDSLNHLRGTAIPDAAKVLARIFEELT